MSDFDAASGHLARLVESSVVGVVRGEPKVAVAFSGGLDSSIVTKCAMKHAEVVACTAFSKGARDATKALKAAAMLGVDLVATELTAENVSEALGTIDLPFEPTLMDRSLWCLYTLVSRSASESGARVLLLGQLADELFGGYAKYAEALRLNGDYAAKKIMSRDLQEYTGRGKVRDVEACKRWVQPRFPFEADDLVQYASSLPMSFKIREGVRKAVLRRAAVLLGVPGELAGAAKKAAQYSSGVQKLVAVHAFNAPD